MKLIYGATALHLDSLRKFADLCFVAAEGGRSRWRCGHVHNGDQPGGQANHGERITKPARLGVLLAALILASVTINGLIIAADSSLR
jgi:hypothetical protein